MSALILQDKYAGTWRRRQTCINTTLAYFTALLCPGIGEFVFRDSSIGRNSFDLILSLLYRIYKMILYIELFPDTLYSRRKFYNLNAFI